MKRWYTVKVKYTKMIEKNGEEVYKQISESFLLQATSFTEAEAVITEEISSQASGEFLVQAMSLTDVVEIHRTEDGENQWYLCKIVISEEDDKGKISKIKQNYMIQGESVKGATKILEDVLSDAMFDFEITNISLSNIIDVLENE